jgi:hypothetical protein
MGDKGDKGDKGDRGDRGEAAAASFRVVSPDAAAATCNPGEVLISAYCTGTWTNYPLKPTANGAACGEAGTTDVKVTIVCARQ